MSSCPVGSLTSDADGMMVVHHTANFLEFAGREYRNLLGMRFGETDSPQYDCVFSLGGREVHRLRYDVLKPKSWEGTPTVTKPFGPLDWPEWDSVRRNGEGTTARWRRLFDCNRDGELDREESTAASYFDDVVLERMGGHPEQKERWYLVVERTITVKVP